MRPSASWPTPARGERPAIWSFVKSSSDRNTGAEPRTSTGPPPSAAPTFAQAGCRISRAVTCGADGSLGLELGGERAGRLDDRSSGRDRLAAVHTHRADGGGQVGVRRRRGEGLQDDLGRAGNRRRLRPERGSEQDDLPLGRGLVEAAQLPALPRSPPRAEELDPVHVQPAGGVDTDRGPRAVGRMLQHPARHEDPRRVPVGRAEEIAVDAGHGCLGRNVLLDLRELLTAAQHRPACEDRLELKEAVLIARPRSGEHVQDDGAVGCELHGAVVGEPREQGRALRLGGSRKGRREQQQSRETAEHPRPRVAKPQERGGLPRSYVSLARSARPANKVRAHRSQDEWRNCMRKLTYMAALLVGLVATGYAVADGMEGAKSVSAVAGTFSAAGANTSSRTCTTTDGKTIVVTDGRYTGQATGDADLTGAITLRARSVINTTDGIGVVSGSLKIAQPTGGRRPRTTPRSTTTARSPAWRMGAHTLRRAGSSRTCRPRSRPHPGSPVASSAAGRPEELPSRSAAARASRPTRRPRRARPAERSRRSRPRRSPSRA